MPPILWSNDNNNTPRRLQAWIHALHLLLSQKRTQIVQILCQESPRLSSPTRGSCFIHHCYWHLGVKQFVYINTFYIAESFSGWFVCHSSSDSETSGLALSWGIFTPVLPSISVPTRTMGKKVCQKLLVLEGNDKVKKIIETMKWSYGSNYWRSHHRIYPWASQALLLPITLWRFQGKVNDFNQEKNHMLDPS